MERWQSEIHLRLLILIAVGLALIGCSRSLLREARLPIPKPVVSDPAAGSTIAAAEGQAPGAERNDAAETAAAQEALAEAPADLWERLRRGFRLEHPLNPRIEHELRRLTRSPHQVQTLMRRGEPYFHLILERIEQRGLPAELVLLPAVESAYRPTAYSYSGAAGLWQIMPATGRRNGLRLDDWYDGRRDIFDSTEAALDLLQRLNDRFDGDWLLALAAYNAGPGRVSGALRRGTRAGRSDEYWDLELPRETDHYVPRLLALAEIVARPEQFGIELPEMANEPRLERIDAGERTDLRIAARVAGMSREELLRLNAGYKAMTTRPDGPHWIVVPVEAVDRLSEGLAGLDLTERLPAKDLRHRIRRGETLGGIARRYGVSVASLRRANHLKGHLIRSGRELIVPGRLETAGAARLELSEAPGPEKEHQRIRHQVRKGDSLYLIARRYKVSVKALRRWNDIQGKFIRPGQELTVFVDDRRLAL